MSSSTATFGRLLGSLYGDLPAPKTSSGLQVSTSPVVSQQPPPQLQPSSQPSNEKPLTPPTFSAPSSNAACSTATAVVPPTENLKVESTLKSPPGPLQPASLDWARDRNSLLLLQPTTRKREKKSTPTGTNGGEKKITENIIVEEVGSGVLSPFEMGNTLCSIANEYDPFKPNNYDDYVKERQKQIRKRDEELRRMEEIQILRNEQKNKTKNFENNNLNVSGEQAWQRRAQLTAAIFGPTPTPYHPPPSPFYGGTSVHSNTSDTNTNTVMEDDGSSTGAGIGNKAGDSEFNTGKGRRGFAQKLLERMGWKHGEGLGREKQGILVPLVARKTDKRSGVIVHGTTAKKEPKQSKTPTALSNGDATRMVVLSNLVGIGEVDEELKAEVTEEASRYGNLLNISIKENAALPENQSVQIYLEYDSTGAAIAAFNSFNGRLFGGRKVHARFFLPSTT